MRRNELLISMDIQLLRYFFWHSSLIINIKGLFYMTETQPIHCIVILVEWHHTTWDISSKFAKKHKPSNIKKLNKKTKQKQLLFESSWITYYSLYFTALDTERTLCKL